MVVAPHRLAAQAGCDILRDGGNAIEAMVAAAAAIAVAYPHMNALGGDNFWLISKAGSRRSASMPPVPRRRAPTLTFTGPPAMTPFRVAARWRQ